MLKEIREKRGLTQKELAKKSGINFRMISQYEQGIKNLNNARLITILKLANALDTSIFYLLTDKDLQYEMNKYIKRIK